MAHSMERMRYVARADGVDELSLVHEVALLLSEADAVPGEMVAAARRILSHQPSCGPLHALCASMLVSLEPIRAAEELIDALHRQVAADELAKALPGAESVLAVGDGAVTVEALAARPDLDVAVLSTPFAGHRALHRLEAADRPVAEYELELVSHAVRQADLVLVEPHLLDGTRAVAGLGTVAALAVAALEGVPVWCVVGAGRALPAPLFQAALGRLDERVDHPHATLETARIADVGAFVSAHGSTRRLVVDSPDAPELHA